MAIEKKGEEGEEYKDTALREVLEESGAQASIIKYVGKSEYTFNVPEDTVEKEVHWYLMMADSYYSKPQKEEYFVDSGFYKYHEAIHLLIERIDIKNKTEFNIQSTLNSVLCEIVSLAQNR